MKQKITTGIITALLMTVLPINSVYAAESYNMADIDGYTAVYFLDENSDTVVTEIRGDFSEINIPRQIDGHNVTGIGRYAFFENTQLVIPNSVMNSAVIDNRRRNEKGYVCMLSVPVAYESDIEKVRSVINKVLSETEGVIDVRSQAQKKAGNPFVNVRVENFLDSGVEMKFPVACADYISSFAVCSSVRSSLLEEFAKENIEIPYNKVQILQ